HVALGATDGGCSAAVIPQLAVSGCIRVEPIARKYRLSRLMCGLATVNALSAEEKNVLAELFADAPAVEISPSMQQTNAAQNSRYIARIHQELERRLGSKYVDRH